MMISQLFFNLFSNITVERFIPSHVALILLIGEITYIFDYKDIDSWIFFSKSIFFVICLFLQLIYAEIIELHFCGLSRDTIKTITMKGPSIDDTIKDDIIKDERDYSYVSEEGIEIGESHEKNDKNEDDMKYIKQKVK